MEDRKRRNRRKRRWKKVGERGEGELSGGGGEEEK
jgi:hypothetical protein